jgi:hypothetical protein
MAEYPCPGCPRTIPPHLVACPRCWPRLPKARRREVTAAFQSGDMTRYGELRGQVQAWFRDHPPRAARAVHASMNRPNR